MGTRKIILASICSLMTFAASAFDISSTSNRDHMRDMSRTQAYQDFPYGGDARVSYDVEYARVLNEPIKPANPKSLISEKDITEIDDLPIMLEGEGKINLIDAITLLSRSLGYSDPEVLRSSLNSKVIVLPHIQGNVGGYVEYLEMKCDCNINMYSRSKSVVVF